MAPIICEAALVLPVTIVGMTELSHTRRLLIPWTQRGIDNGKRIGAHLAGTDRMEVARRRVAGEVRKLSGRQCFP